MISTPLQGEFVEEYEQDKLYGSRDARVVSFDFGGTLADLDKERHVAYFETFNELGLTVDVELLKEKLVEAHDLIIPKSFQNVLEKKQIVEI